MPGQHDAPDLTPDDIRTGIVANLTLVVDHVNAGRRIDQTVLGLQHSVTQALVVLQTMENLGLA